MKSFHLICNMPMFLEENFRSFWKSPQVFRSHLKSFESQKSVNSLFNPNVHLSSFQTKKKISLLALFLVPKQLLQSFSPTTVEVSLPLESCKKKVAKHPIEINNIICGFAAGNPRKKTSFGFGVSSFFF